MAGAFHTPYMAPAETALAAVAAGVTVADPARDPAVQPGRRGRHRTAGSCSSAWSARSPRRSAGTCACGRSRDLGVTGVIELPPAGTLAGLVKRELKGDGAPEIVTLNTPDDLPAARDLIARHGWRPKEQTR